MCLINLCNISKVFGNGQLTINALNSINLKIEKGSFTAISGPSGSGKSTLLNIMGLLDIPTKGEYYFDNKLINYNHAEKLDYLRSNELGFVFQNFNLLPVLTALENVQMSALYSVTSKKKRKLQAKYLLKQVGLLARQNSFPNQLSGGEQQRVAVARALMGNPKLILADEPTANLDSDNTFRLINLMKKLNKESGIAFLFSTHDERVLKNVNQVIKMTDGRISVL